MIRICPCCDQMLPETNAEKGIAKAKAGIAKSKRDEAIATWESFRDAHQVARGFWERNPMYGMSVSIIVAMFLYLICLRLIIVDNDGMDFPSAWILISIFVALIVFSVLGYFLVKRPLDKLSMHRKAVRNAFVLRYKATADVLGFEVEWQ